MGTISGVVRDSSIAFCSRLVRAYRCDTGALVGQTLSNPSTGAYSITTTHPGEHLVVKPSGAVDSDFLDMFLGTRAQNSEVIDFSGKSVSLTGATVATETGSLCSKVLSFNGSGHVSISDSASFAPGTGPFSIGGRFKFSSHTTNQTLIGNYANSSTGLSLQRRFDTNCLRLGLGDSSILDASWTPSDGTWYWIDACRDDDGYVRVFVEGSQIGSPALFPTSIGASSNDFIIGGLNYSGSYIQRFNGFAEEVAVWNYAKHPSGFTPPSEPRKLSPTGGTANALSFDLVIPI